MSQIAAALDALCTEVLGLTAKRGVEVNVAAMGVCDRQGLLSLGEPGLVSPNGACRLFQAADGWMALNLARDEDRELIPAWLGCDFADAPWGLVEAHARHRSRAELVAGAVLLGLPAGAVGEKPQTFGVPTTRFSDGASRNNPLKVIDLSSLWAGPMCGAILAATGADVLKIESSRRPDPTRSTTPEFFRRLNRGKRGLAIDLSAAPGAARLREEVMTADVLITSARPRALAAFGLEPETIFAANPKLIWVAVTGYGFHGESATRVAFGDDAAAAGGLVRWTLEGEPRFMGDALADPLTGLSAAVGALRSLEQGGGWLVDASLAGCAANAAMICGRPER